MPKKEKSIYICTNCGAQTLKWSGRCLECGKYGTVVEEAVESNSRKEELRGVKAVQTINLNDFVVSDTKKLKVGISEVDRVLGGGLVAGSLILMSGEPGIGKSTITMQIACRISEQGKVLYVSGEESATQVKGRFSRLDCAKGDFNFMNETNLEKIIVTAQKMEPLLIVVDSIQTIQTNSSDTEQGSLSQIRAATAGLLELAKTNDICVIVVGHVTKDGAIAGPKSLEHMVDTVVYLEADNKRGYRMLRASKNRFGSVNELGIFTMTGRGFKEMKDTSAIFLENKEGDFPGSVISAITQGSRPFLIEIQALVSKTLFGYPQRKVSGYDLNRLQVLTAVLTKRANLNLSNQDVIINVVGGMKISDPGIDAAICMAIASSLLNQVIKSDVLILGEIGLGGEVRAVNKMGERMKVASEFGFKTAYVPNGAEEVKNMELKRISDLEQMIAMFIKL